MRQSIAALAFLLAGCAQNQDPNAPTFGQLIGFLLMDAIANTYTFSDTVHTPDGTYYMTGSCVYSSCESTVRKR
jgi:hypothetical protein